MTNLVTSNQSQPAMEPDTQAPVQSDDLPVTIIRPHPGWRWIDLGELWRYRELFYSLTARDIKVRYKQTALGILWAILQPVLMTLIFSAVLGKGANTSGIPYPVFCMSGYLLWYFFSRSITTAAGSMVQSQALLTKVYFPRLLIPFSSIGAAVIDFALAFGVLLAMMVYYEIALSRQALLVPVLLLVTALAAIGVGTLLAALNVAYRDFKHTLPFLVQIWMFATPTIYYDASVTGSDNAAPAKAVAASQPDAKTTSDQSTTGGNEQTENSGRSRFRRYLVVNPLMGLVAAFRSAILNQPIAWVPLGYSVVSALAALLIGCFYFRRVERTFADIV